MFKWIITVILVLFLCLCGLVVLHGQSERQFYILGHKAMLKIAADDFQKYGQVTNVWSSSDRFWLSSKVVTIAGIQYHCYAEVGGGRFGDEGTLAVTTNHVFIWLASNGPPRIIETGYQSPLLHF